MKIQVATDGGIEGNEALTAGIETDVRSAMDRYGDRLTRVEVHLSDQAGSADGGEEHVRCLVEARPVGMQPVVVTAFAETAEQACHDAVQKMGRLLDNTFGRVDGRDSHATIRQIESA